MGPSRPPCSARSRASTNLDAFSSLIASRRPTFICSGSNAVSVPGPPLRRPVAHGVRPVLLEQSHRRDDVALRLRHLLAVGVEHPAGDGGVLPRQHAFLEVAPQHVENSQVRMMSCACGRTSIGKTFASRSSSSPARPAICGVSEEVAQVSITSGSPTKPPGTPRWAAS